MTGSSEPRPERDSGMSLIELVVAMFAASIILLGVGTVFTGALRSLGEVTAKGSLTQDAQIGMQTMAVKLRAANKIPASVSNPNVNPSYIVNTGSASSISFYAELPEANWSAWTTGQLAWNSDYQKSLQATKSWPYKVEYTLATSGCGSTGLLAGVIEKTTAAVFNNSTGAVTFPGAGTSRCFFRTTSTTGLAFRFFGSGTSPTGTSTSGCVIPDTVTPVRWPTPSVVNAATAPGTVQSVEVSVTAQDSDGQKISLLNQICLTN